MKDERLVTGDAGVSPAVETPSIVKLLVFYPLSFSERSERSFILFQVRNQTEILVSVVEVLAAHTPDESVVVGSGCAMDRPLR